MSTSRSDPSMDWLCCPRQPPGETLMSIMLWAPPSPAPRSRLLEKRKQMIPTMQCTGRQCPHHAPDIFTTTTTSSSSSSSIVTFCFLELTLLLLELPIHLHRRHGPLQFHLSSPSSQHHTSEESGEDDEEVEEEEEEEEECPVSSPFVSDREGGERGVSQQLHHHHPFSIVAVLVAALRKSLVMCSFGPVEDGGCRGASAASMEIGWPTDVRHISHVTFDRFDGFLGLPVELEPEVLRRAPSASASVFGVSAEFMQCPYDRRGNSVPMILLSMQSHLYLQGGMQVEGIFRLNADNSQEIFVRDQLNRGIVPREIEMHCLAGLIKAWFRELPRGVLDSLTPCQVMHCNTEEECCALVKMLPPTEAALLDWAVNLMADVVQQENNTKMNARNIAMVFAPNMTKMADPLTALIHAVQVMNFLKTLIIKTLREREEAVFVARDLDCCDEYPNDKERSKSSEHRICYSLRKTEEGTQDLYDSDEVDTGKFLSGAEYSIDRDEGRLCNSENKNKIEEEQECISSKISSVFCDLGASENGRLVDEDRESLTNRLSPRRVGNLRRHPVFQFSRSTKKPKELSNVGSNEGREVCA